MGKPKGLSRRLVEEKFAICTNCFNKEQLLYLDNYNVKEVQHANDMNAEGINWAGQEKQIGL